MQDLKNENGFGAIGVLLILAVIGVVVFAGIQVTNSDTEPLANIATDGTVSLTPEDQTILLQAKELKKIDFDLDGLNNDVDNDDDNDGINDLEDNDDDNDGQNDDVDTDDDNDGIQDEDENEEQDAQELSEAKEIGDSENSEDR